MPGLNWIPGVSQLKSVCQLVTGDVEGARQTQEDFFNECPGVSHSIALGRAMAGDTEGAEEMCRRSNATISNVANGIPVVGHVKGVVHLVCGDEDGAIQAFQSATRSTVVMGTGVAAGVFTGGVGAIPAAIAAGASYDTVDSVICDKPKGIIAAVDQVVTNPNAGNIFDATAMVVGDGLSGYSGAKLGKQIAAKMEINNLKVARDAKLGEANVKLQQKIDAQIEVKNLDAARAAKVEMLTDGNSGQAVQIGNEINAMTQRIDNLQGTTVEFVEGAKTVQAPVQGTIDVLNAEINTLATEAQTINQTIASMKGKTGGVVVETPNLASRQEIVTEEEVVVGVVAATATMTMVEQVVRSRNRNEPSYHEPRTSTIHEEEVVGDEQAIRADLYCDLVDKALSQEEREAKASRNYSQQPKQNSIKKKNDKTTHWPDRTWQRMAAKFADQQGNDPQRPQLSEEEEQYLTWQAYEEVPLPRELFPYTGVILTNRPSQGLLHSFVRHHDQWVQFIPGLNTIMNQLPVSVRNVLIEIQQTTHQMAVNREHMEELYAKLKKAIEEAANETETRAVRMQIQFKILKYLRGAVQRTYIGDYVYDGGVRHLFRVEQLNGENYVIAVAVSDQLDIQPDRFGGRPFRAIITAFFMKEDKVRKSPNFREYKGEKRF